MDKFILRAQARAVAGRGLVMHASAAEINNRGFVFLSPSGGGKTTIANILGHEGYGIIAEDSVILSRGTDGTMRLFPCASFQWSYRFKPQSCELFCFIFLEKGKPELFYRLGSSYCVYRAIRQKQMMAYGDMNSDEKRVMRNDLTILFNEFPCYALRFSLDSQISNLLNEIC